MWYPLELRVNEMNGLSGEVNDIRITTENDGTRPLVTGTPTLIPIVLSLPAYNSILGFPPNSLTEILPEIA